MRYVRLVLSTVILSTLLVAALPQRAYACSCLAQTIEESYNNSTVVFSGSISEMNGTSATFTVDEIFKGDVPARVTVNTPQDSAACGLNFTENSEWIIFANNAQIKMRGAYEANLCGGSHPFNSDLNSVSEDTGYMELLGLAEDAGTYSQNSTTNDNTFVYALGGAIVGLALVTAVVYFYRKGKK